MPRDLGEIARPPRRRPCRRPWRCRTGLRARSRALPARRETAPRPGGHRSRSPRRRAWRDRRSARRSSPRPAARGRRSGTPRPRRRVTSPSTRAILAPSAITPMVKAIWRRPGWSSGSAGAASRPCRPLPDDGRRRGPPSRPAARRSARRWRSRRARRRSCPQIFMPASLRDPRSQDQGRRSPRRPAERVQDGDRNSRWPAETAARPAGRPQPRPAPGTGACTPVCQSTRPRADEHQQRHQIDEHEIGREVGPHPRHRFVTCEVIEGDRRAGHAGQAVEEAADDAVPPGSSAARGWPRKRQPLASSADGAEHDAPRSPSASARARPGSARDCRAARRRRPPPEQADAAPVDVAARRRGSSGRATAISSSRQSATPICRPVERREHRRHHHGRAKAGEAAHHAGNEGNGGGRSGRKLPRISGIRRAAR